ncbi:MFS transporter [Catellatospora sichuanensis]|uniref:MFS transporter n=1 Tax=Catellatospora sichuanensis TaxID=1969805 RepID=UPI002482D951|nr:MFS transporter [Catellatospora sichuanensis]
MFTHGPLRSRPFRYVWGGETLSMVGDAAYQIVFIWLVLSISDSPAVLAAVLVATGIPRGVLLLVGGAVTDRFSPRAVMLGSHLVRGVLLTILTVLAASGGLRVWHFFAIGIAFGIADAFFWPASGSIVPSLVREPDLPRANALIGVAEQASGFVGPILGGVLLTTTSSAFALAFNAATFFVAALTLLAAPKASGAPVQDTRYSVAQLLREVRGGLAHAGRNTEVRMVLLLISAATLSYSGLFAVGLPTLAGRFPDGPIVLGVMVTAWGLGQLVGATSASVTGLPRRWGLLIIAMAIVEGTCFAVLGFAPHYLVAVALLAVLGIGVAYSTDVALPTFIQTRTPPNMLGRVNAVINLPRVVLEPVSIAAMGALAVLDVRWTFALAAVPMLLVGIGLATSATARRLSTSTPQALDTDLPQRLAVTVSP